MKKLLVMSVYGHSSARWYDIQKNALRRTTLRYEHALWLNNLEGDFPESTVVGTQQTSLPDKEQHHQGLLRLLEYARNGDYRAWLVLDCDCFPIHPNWETILGNRNAAIVRAENLDIFPHPSAVYCVDQKLDFEISKQVNLLGQEFDELRATWRLAGIDYFPLLRTNRINRHPLMCGVYYDLFYHHCAGSRNFDTRSDTYYKARPKKMDERFFRDPEAFVKPLISNLHELDVPL